MATARLAPACRRYLLIDSDGKVFLCPPPDLQRDTFSAKGMMHSLFVRYSCGPATFQITNNCITDASVPS
jgi:hypothetical protein